jgi:hypothetical protein
LGINNSSTAEIPVQVGSAVVHMCTSPEIYSERDRDTDGKVVKIGPLTNCIEHVDYVHSTDIFVAISGPAIVFDRSASFPPRTWNCFLS